MGDQKLAFKEKQLDQIESKIDKLEVRLHSIDKSLVKYNAELEYHIVRTDELQNHVSKVESFMLEMQKHVHMVQGVAAFFALAAAVIAVLEMLRG